MLKGGDWKLKFQRDQIGHTHKLTYTHTHNHTHTCHMSHGFFLRHLLVTKNAVEGIAASHHPSDLMWDLTSDCQRSSFPFCEADAKVFHKKQDEGGGFVGGWEEDLTHTGTLHCSPPFYLGIGIDAGFVPNQCMVFKFVPEKFLKHLPIFPICTIGAGEFVPCSIYPWLSLLKFVVHILW